jgi:DNA-directed RNA polymerase subunit RPC12/RpoP
MRAIDIEFAERAITDYKRAQTVSHYATSEECKAVWYGMELAIMVLHGCPTIDAEPVVHSHWEEGGKTLKDLYCIECGYILPRKCNSLAEEGAFLRCPNCGAHMDGGEA